MKRLLPAVLAALMVCLTLAPAKAAVGDLDIPVDIAVNGQLIKSDAYPYLTQGRTYAPIRMLGEALQTDEILWDGTQETVTVKLDATKIELPVGSSHAFVNGRREALPGPVKKIGSRTYAPVRFLCETLGADIEWDSSYFTVQVSKDGVTVPSHLRFYDYGTDEMFWLGRIIEAESSGEPLQGKTAVGNVILNRVESTDFPNTIYGVIFDRNYGVQFQPVANGTIYNSPSSDSIVAAKRALNNDRPAGDALYFLNPRVATNSWIPQNRTFLTSIANHDFYL